MRLRTALPAGLRAASILALLTACGEGPVAPPASSPPDPSAAADLSVAVEIDATEVTVGDLVTVTVQVQNSGPAAAERVRISATVPATATALSGSNAARIWTESVGWSITSIASGVTRTVEATLIATGSGESVLTAAASSSSPDPNPADNDGTAPGHSASLRALPAPAPVDLGDAWPLAAPADAELDAATLATLARRIEAGEFLHVHALQIARAGRLAYDAYFHEHTPARTHSLQSVTKSVGSLLVGIAADQGALSPDDALPVLLPERAAAYAADPAKNGIRLSDVLSMRVGLRWDEWTCSYQNETCNSNRQMNNSADWIGYVLDQPVVETPGTRFVYNSGGSNLLGAIVKSRTGRDPVEFAHEHLFGPLDIAPEDVTWFRNTEHPDSLPHVGGGLRLRSRDLAKMGQLVLDRGEWNGRRVVSEEWIAQSTRFRTSVPTGHGYGWQWWRMSLPSPTAGVASGEVIFGWGYGGQHVFIVPALDLVVSTNSWNPDGTTRGFEIFEAVLEAVR
ncbi:MAG: serine hydrolase [Gemmatimonadota bacterium]